MSSQTDSQYKDIVMSCKDIFIKKTKDYGLSWKILRLSSLTDQIFIKASRIRSLQEKNKQEIPEGQWEEFVAIVNYCIMAQIQCDISENIEVDLSLKNIELYYEKAVQETKKLVIKKNHDYDEAWKKMRVSSMTDIILMKLLRIKQIENNEGKTLISEGVKSNYQDIMNYAIFCLIKLNP